jgi:histidyl-tRNA synthetase
MREANRRNARYAVIVGTNELAAQQAQVKDLSEGDQVEVAFTELQRHLRLTLEGAIDAG